MTKPSSDRRKELDQIFEKCLLIFDFSISHTEINDFLFQMRAIMVKCYEQGDLKGVKTILRTIIPFAKELPLELFIQLNKEYKTNFGENLDDQNKKIVLRIKRKGFINSESEFRVVLDKVEELLLNKENLNEVDYLNTLLADFEKKRIK